MRFRLTAIVGACRCAAAAGLALGALAVWLQSPAGAQQFRSTVSLVAVDVQVLDGEGYPVTTLGAGDFQVSIGGRPRRVVSVDVVRHGGEVSAGAPRSPGSEDPGLQPFDPGLQQSLSPPTGRLIVVAIDSASFDAATWQRASLAAQNFLSQLDPDDRVGFYVFPEGVAVAPTTDHWRISRAIAETVASGQPLATQFNLSPAEVVDIAAEAVILRSPGSAFRRGRGLAIDEGQNAPTVEEVHMRECAADQDCPARILLEAGNAALQLETRALQSLAGLTSMSQVLAEWPGRKTVVLLSRGITVSDRPGGRPDPGDVSRVLGQAIARSNAAIYTLHVESTPQAAYSVTRRVIGKPGAEHSRELRMNSMWLEQFSDAAGGTLLRVGLDYGAEGWRQVLRETSAYYLLGVQPEAADRDGRLRGLDVEVNRPGVTVRNRLWVVIPAS
jgi:VWFA-related protein